MKKMKLLIGIISVFIIAILLCNKPISRIVEVKSNFYSAPANSAFVDEKFYKCTIDGYNKNHTISLGYDISLTDEQLASIVELNCYNYNIVDTAGIEKLTGLRRIYLPNNSLTEIDISHNTALKSLNLSKNKLTNIDLSNNTSLTELNLSNNQLTNIDLSHNTALTYLDLSDNRLTNIDLSHNTSLKELRLSYNQLTNIDLSHNTALTALYLGSNKFSNIDLSHNTSLTALYLGSNQFSNIDLSHYTSLTELDLSNNQLTNIDLSHNTSLTKLNLSNNQFSNIDLSPNTSLTELYLSSNKFTNIDLSHNTSLEVLKLDSNQLTEIDLSQKMAMRVLSLNKNQLKEIDLSNNLVLKELYLFENQLTDIDLSNNTVLTKLDLDSNQLTEIDLSKNVLLETLSLRYNYLTYFDLSNTGVSFKSTPTQTRTYYVFNNDFSVIDDQEILERLKASSNKKYVAWYTYIDCLGNEDEFDFEYYMKLLSITSDIYKIDFNNNYIYVGSEQDEDIMSDNIFLGGSSEIVGVIDDNHYILRNVDTSAVLKTMDLVSLKSDKYDLTKNYLMGNIEDIVNNVTVTNGSFTYDSVKNVFQVKYNDIVLQEFDYVNFTSEKYDLSKDFIKVNDSDISSFLSNINCLNCDLYIYNGTENVTTGDFGDGYKLRVMDDDELIKEYDLKYSVLGVSLNMKELELNLDTKKTFQLTANIIPNDVENNNVTWLSSDSSVVSVDENGLVTAKALGGAAITVKTEDGNFIDKCDVFVREIVVHTVTFKDGNDVYTSQFEEGNEVLFKTDLSKTGYNLVGWKYNNQNYSLTDKLLMPGDDIELEAVWELSVPEIKNYASDGYRITDISLKTNVEGLNLGIDSIYQVKVSKHDGSAKTSGLVGTGDKVKVYLDNQLVSEYDVIIKGDITGTGTSTVSDVAKLYQYMKGKVTMDDCYVKAGNVVDNDNIIKVNDVAKLYQFIKGKISNL